MRFCVLKKAAIFPKAAEQDWTYVAIYLYVFFITRLKQTVMSGRNVVFLQICGLMSGVCLGSTKNIFSNELWGVIFAKRL